MGTAGGSPSDSCQRDTITAPPSRARVTDSIRLADHCTFRVGGPCRRLVVATSEQQAIEVVQAADQAGEPVLILSGGSNLLVADEGFPGTVVVMATRGISAEVSACGALVSVRAGEVWDDLVAYTVAQGWAGLEALSGIPGLVGAAPIQNVGAYGQEVAQTIARVRTWDRQTGQQHTFVADECGFGYRDSIFKQSRQPGQASGRYLVLEVVFRLRLASLSEPIAYDQLARALAVEVGTRVPAEQARAQVLALRAGKGMVVDPGDHDSWSAGSFFTNPIVGPALAGQLPAEAPRFPADDGRVKLSAAWLIDHAGCPKGYPGHGPARLSSKHVLALTNRGQASAADICALAADVRARVKQVFGVRLELEPILVGLQIPG